MPRGRTSSAPSAERGGAEFAYRPWRYLASFVVYDRRIANSPDDLVARGEIFLIFAKGFIEKQKSGLQMRVRRKNAYL